MCHSTSQAVKNSVACFLRDYPEIPEQFSKRPLNSWGRRSWVTVARVSARAYDRADSRLGGDLHELAKEIWRAAHNYDGTEECFYSAWRTARQTAAAFHYEADPSMSDYEDARGCALWMEENYQ